MSFISNNAYRVLGVCSNASLKDIQKNISQLKAFAKIGKEMDLGYNLSFLNLANIDRKDDLLLRSENQLNLDKNKITSSLFWFADLSPIDAVALAHLIKADVSKAIEIWDKATTSKEVSLNNYSAFNNLSTLLLLSTLDDSKTDTFKKDTDSIKQIKKAIKLKNEFISSTFFNNYCESISKSTPLSSDAAQDFFTNTILDLFNKNFSPKELSDLFEGLDDKLKDTLNASLTEAPISNIKNHIETASELIKKNEKSGIKVGKQLIKDTLKDIKYLKEIFSQDDFQFQTLSDKLSNLILQCGIVCFNKTGDDQDYLTSYQYALSIAIDEKAKERAKDCIKHCKEQKEANICKFCNQNEISSNSSFRIEMHKMTGYNSYTYFKDGGIEVSCCNSCSGQKSQKNVIAFLVAFVIWAGVAALTYGWLLIIDSVFTQFTFPITKWWFKLIKKNIYLDTIIDHPTIKGLVREGYKFGMP
jgi:hypothetical protein